METSGYSGPSATPSEDEGTSTPIYEFFTQAPPVTPAPAETVQSPAPAPAPVAEPPSDLVDAEQSEREPEPQAVVPEPEPQAVVHEPEPQAPTTTLLVEPVTEPSAAESPLGGSWPMSLAIAAEEAAQVELVPEAPSRTDYQAFYEQAGESEQSSPEQSSPEQSSPESVPEVSSDLEVEAPEPAEVLTPAPEPLEDHLHPGTGPEDVAAGSLASVDAHAGDETYEDAYGEPTVGLMDAEADGSAYQRSSTEQTVGDEKISLSDLLIHVLETGASDLHLTTGARPAVRLNGHLEQMEDYPVLTPPVIQRIMYAAITQRQREKFEEELELDFAYSVPGRARFRVNLYRQRDSLGAAFRLIPFEIKRLEELGVPPQVANFANIPRGMVLITGPTGSGKSTTLASIVDLANRTRKDHIMTCEDPIEFLHRHQSCIVNQREVGEDTRSFANALKHVLRQDPDIILVGEMRDLETISIALTAAETGHLVFATLHTQDAAQTIDRMIDAFPPHQQQQVRTQLAGALQGVVCQTLCRTADGRGRQVAVEVMVATPAVRNLIREGKTHQIYSAMQAGSKFGMQTMDQHLADLVNKGRITHDVGIEKCHHIEDFKRLTGRG